MDPGRGVPWRTITAVMVRPGLWATAATELRLLARPGWWHHWPPLPRPDPAYLRFRFRTAYGADEARTMAPEELVDFLRWCRRMRRLGR